MGKKTVRALSESCPFCHGTGYRSKVEEYYTAHYPVEYQTECKECNGKGRISKSLISERLKKNGK